MTWYDEQKSNRPVAKLSLADRSSWKCGGAVAAFHLGHPVDRPVAGFTLPAFPSIHFMLVSVL
jgi:hypothetical protein